MIAGQILNNHMLSFFHEHGVLVNTVLGREDRGRKERNRYELFLRSRDAVHERDRPFGELLLCTIKVGNANHSSEGTCI